ncbi:MAG TPA: cell division protein FtsQ/DivIB [Burkholderiaceae bacterium]|nr:cell division protein FtsQ/DivIB [Burkholderiaceae bacterium]
MARRAPNRRNAAPGALPLDVRLMNGVAGAVFVLALGALALAAAKWAMRSPAFTIHRLVLEAPLARANLASVRANALPRLQGNFFSADLDAMRAAFETVPWVRRATVRRVWPDRLAVTLEEHQPAALWQGERGVDRVVNTHGEVFEANLGDVEDEGLPTFAGPDGRATQMLALWRRLDAALAPLDEPVAVLRLTPRGSWRAELDGGATLELGRGSEEEIVARVERLVRTLPAVSARFGGAPRALVAADLRHPDGYALRLAGISTPGAAPTR